MISAAIVEDEYNSSEILKTLLQEYCEDINVLDVYTNIKDAERGLKQKMPQILFLDVKLSRDYSFDLLERIDYHQTQLIFTTAYNEYALNAIKLSALDYLLKPLNIKDLVAAVEKAKIRIQKEEDFLKVKTLLNNVKSDEAQSQIALPTSTGFVFIETKKIIRFEADGSYTNVFYSPGNKIMVTRQLKEYDEMLSDRRFFRVHHSHLVNLDHVKEYVRGSGGYLLLSDGSKVDVATRRKDELLKALSAY
jgi:two-component system, LytTR family, response regulator